MIVTGSSSARPGAPRSNPQDAAPRAGLPARPLIFVLQLYRRWISPALPPTCRFYPTCSTYAVQALTVHGVLRGSWLTVRRLLRCAPWHPGGIDPVPPPRSARSPAESESSC